MGMASRYSNALRKILAHDVEMAEAKPELRHVYSGLGKVTAEALASELPFIFRIEPGNMSQSVVICKINPIDSTHYPYSYLVIGLFGGLAEEARPANGFDREDVDFAMRCIESQRLVGLNTGF